MHIAAACQYMPVVANCLEGMGWNRSEVEGAIDFTGVHQCLQLLRERHIFVAIDGTIHSNVEVGTMITKSSILWGQSRKLFAPLSSALQTLDERCLRDDYNNDPRALARLNSASGKVAGKWLEAFPTAWWPTFHDTSFIMALRLRCGMHVSVLGQHCMHTKLKDRDVKCEKCLDVWGDHAISCGFGGHLFTRHTAVNNVLAEAGRAAGYTVHCEQVVPELTQFILKDGVASI